MSLSQVGGLGGFQQPGPVKYDDQYIHLLDKAASNPESLSTDEKTMFAAFNVSLGFELDTSAMDFAATALGKGQGNIPELLNKPVSELKVEDKLKVYQYKVYINTLINPINKQYNFSELNNEQKIQVLQYKQSMGLKITDVERNFILGRNAKDFLTDRMCQQIAIALGPRGTYQANLISFAMAEPTHDEIGATLRRLEANLEKGNSYDTALKYLLLWLEKPNASINNLMIKLKKLIGRI